EGSALPGSRSARFAPPSPRGTLFHRVLRRIGRNIRRNGQVSQDRLGYFLEYRRRDLPAHVLPKGFVDNNDDRDHGIRGWSKSCKRGDELGFRIVTGFIDFLGRAGFARSGVAI